MITRNRIYTLLALLILLAVGTYVYYAIRDDHQTDRHIVLYGNVDVRQVNLAFKIPGRLRAVNVEEGDTVKAGKLIAILEPQDYEDDVSLSQARVLGQAAQLAALQTGTRPQEIDQAAAILAEANASLSLAENTLKRQQFWQTVILSPRKALKQPRPKEPAPLPQKRLRKRHINWRA